jgi:two-component system response regulator RstA
VDIDQSAKILIVEDDERLAELTCDYLTNNGLSVSVEHNGAVAVDRIKAEQPDLVILDLMLPGEDGLSVCRLVRSAYSGPIIMLTARTDELDQVVGLEVGADDYICKPVAPRLLLARISAMLRRTKKSQAVSDTDASSVSEDSRHHFGRLVIDNSMREAWLGDDGIELTSAEFDLLWLLASNAGRVINREEIFTALRGIPYDGQDRSIDVRVSRIRPKIGDDPDHPRRIKTVRSRGYLFVKEH